MILFGNFSKKKEVEIDLDEVMEAKRIMGVKSESSPYAHIAQVYVIGSDQGESNPSLTPRVDCKIDGIKCCNVLCDVGAHVSVMSSKVYVELFNETSNLDATIIKLIMGDGRLIKPLGVLRNLNVAIAGKDIPTDFFVINASDDEHESIILGKPFLKLVNAILDVGKGIVTFDLDGEKHTFKFHSKPSRALPLPLDNEEVESIRFIDSFRDPLQRALENGDAQDDQDGELVETMEELKHEMVLNEIRKCASLHLDQK